MIIIGGSLLFVIILIIVLASVNKPAAVKTVVVQKPSLIKYEDSTSSVSFTTYGGLVADSQRTTISITISAANVNSSVFNGYQETLVNSENFANNQTAYNYFLNNLDSQGFLVSKKTKLSESSACPNGETYQVTLTDNSKVISSLWDDSCNTGVDGTFYGNGQQNITAIQTLFQNQISNYSFFVSTYTL